MAEGISAKFSAMSRRIAHAAGTWQAFAAATALILAWLLGAFWFGFTDQLYQLLINTVTTIVTFELCFIIQGSQNRDTIEIKAMLGELIRANEGARNAFISLEHLPDEDLKRVAAALAAAIREPPL